MRLLLVALSAVMLASTAFPDPIQCQSDTLANYEALASGCVIGDKLFSGFAYHPNPLNLTTQVPDTAITVAPITGPDIGLKFSGPFSFSGLQVFHDTLIDFTVATVDHSPRMTG